MSVDDRVGGRRANQLRPLSCELGLLNRADGSVRYSQGTPLGCVFVVLFCCHRMLVCCGLTSTTDEGVIVASYDVPWLVTIDCVPV
jgi:exosome complex RNA-binding protein Rrp42 (RNase PH superfamily)